MRRYVVLGLVLAGCSRGPQEDARAVASVNVPGAVASVSQAPAARPSASSSDGGPEWPLWTVTPGRSLPITTTGTVRQGSTVVLATLEGRSVALVADGDAGAVQVIDRGAGSVIATLRLEAAPAQMIATRDGKLLVTLRGGHGVAVLGGRADQVIGRDGTLPTAAEPYGLALTPDGSTVLVTTAWGRKLEALALPSGERSFVVDVPRDPRAVLVTDDGAFAFVSHAAGSVMSRVALTGEHEVQAVRLDGVTNLPSYMGNHSYRSGSQGFSVAQLGERVFAPQALMNNGLRLEKMGHCTGGDMEPTRDHRTSVDVYGNGCDDPYPVALQSVAVIEAAEPRMVPAKLREPTYSNGDNYEWAFFHRSLGPGLVAEPRSVVLPDNVDARDAHRFNACVLPRAAAIDEANQSLLVACLGSDVLLELDATVSDPARHELRRFRIPAGATGVAVDAARREALVFGQFDRALYTLPLGPAELPTKGKERAHNQLVTRTHHRNKADLVGEKIKTVGSLEPTAQVDLTAAGALIEPMATGRRLFHSLGNQGISGDGRTCASCHPDGRDDGLVWAAPGGPRQTMMLAGRPLNRTSPFGWRGEHASLDVHVSETFRRLRGKGLGKEETDAVLAYLQWMPGPPRDVPAAGVVARGKELFAGRAGCVGCHGGDATTDGLTHDVRSGGAFDTPSLALVGGTAPYFHDGRYKTLRALLLDCDGKMGSTGDLSPADLDALEAYLGTL